VPDSGRFRTGTKNTVSTPASAAWNAGESDSSARIEISAPGRSGALAAIWHNQPLPVPASGQQRRNLTAHLTEASVLPINPAMNPLNSSRSSPGQHRGFSQASLASKPLTHNLHNRLQRAKAALGHGGGSPVEVPRPGRPA
jgi:hypothetical protein